MSRLTSPTLWPSSLSLCRSYLRKRTSQSRPGVVWVTPTSGGPDRSLNGRYQYRKLTDFISNVSPVIQPPLVFGLPGSSCPLSTPTVWRDESSSTTTETGVSPPTVSWTTSRSPVEFFRSESSTDRRSVTPVFALVSGRITNHHIVGRHRVRGQCVCLCYKQVIMNPQRKIIWPGGETEKPIGYQMSTKLKVLQYFFFYRYRKLLQNTPVVAPYIETLFDTLCRISIPQGVVPVTVQFCSRSTNCVLFFCFFRLWQFIRSRSSTWSQPGVTGHVKKSTVWMESWSRRWFVPDPTVLYQVLLPRTFDAVKNNLWTRSQQRNIFNKLKWK